MIKLLEFPSHRGKEEALEIVDGLRKAVEDDEIIAFAVVGIEPNDGTKVWMASTKKFSRLRMIGATAALHHAQFHED